MKAKYLLVTGILVLISIATLSLFLLNSREQPKYPYNLKPIAIAYYDDGSIAIEYRNMYDRVLKVTSVELNETIDGVNCANVSARDRIISEVWLRKDEGFTLMAICPKKKAGDPFDLFVEMNYTENSGVHKAYHTEQGHIRGQVVSTNEPLRQCSSGCYQRPAIL